MILKGRFFRATAIVAGLAATCAVARDNAAAGQTTTFTTSQNGIRITCGLVNGRYVPGSGSRSRFVSTESALKALAGKKDAKSKAKAKKLKAYLKTAKSVCKSRRPAARPSPTVTPVGNTPAPTPVPSVGSATRGAAVFASKCGGCHSTADLSGRSASQLNVRGMPALSDQEAKDLAAYVN